jgi:hypothetical protein
VETGEDEEVEGEVLGEGGEEVEDSGDGDAVVVGACEWDVLWDTVCLLQCIFVAIVRLSTHSLVGMVLEGLRVVASR